SAKVFRADIAIVDPDVEFTLDVQNQLQGFDRIEVTVFRNDQRLAHGARARSLPQQPAHNPGHAISYLVSVQRPREVIESNRNDFNPTNDGVLSTAMAGRSLVGLGFGVRQGPGRVWPAP